MSTEKDPQSAECPECHSENIVILAGGRTECGECGRALVERPATKDEPSAYELAEPSGAVESNRAK